jgi:hypothetical protein
VLAIDCTETELPKPSNVKPRPDPSLSKPGQLTRDSAGRCPLCVGPKAGASQQGSLPTEGASDRHSQLDF